MQCSKILSVDVSQFDAEVSNLCSKKCLTKTAQRVSGTRWLAEIWLERTAQRVSGTRWLAETWLECTAQRVSGTRWLAETWLERTAQRVSGTRWLAEKPKNKFIGIAECFSQRRKFCSTCRGGGVGNPLHQRVSGTADLQGQCFHMLFHLQVQGVPAPLHLRVKSTFKTPAPASQRYRWLAAACVWGPPAPASQNLYFSNLIFKHAYLNIPFRNFYHNGKSVLLVGFRFRFLV